MMLRLVERDGTRCAYCQKETSERKNSPLFRTIDHVIPRSKGGPDTLDNLAVACTTCNGKKADYSLEVFRKIQTGEIHELMMPKLKPRRAGVPKIPNDADVFEDVISQDLNRMLMAGMRPGAIAAMTSKRVREFVALRVTDAINHERDSTLSLSRRNAELKAQLDVNRRAMKNRNAAVYAYEQQIRRLENENKRLQEVPAFVRWCADFWRYLLSPAGPSHSEAKT